MAWPQATDYNAAVQAPALCFGDADLRQGQVEADLFGLPRPYAGNFADVYQVQNGGASWAVKCFTRPVENLRQRYQAVSDHLCLEPRPFMVDFVYLEEGIRVRGQWYPALKMQWVEWLRLNEFVAAHLDRPAVLERLAQMWLRLSQELRAARMAHGDLQHGNVLLVPGSKASLLSLKLIDYDGLYVPALADQPSGEVGHPNYQHPQRLDGGLYSPEVDRFAHLVIFTALHCLCTGGAPLWERHDSGENLLFREEDFRNPARSKLWPELLALADAEARALVGHLLLAGQGPIGAVPTLEELHVGGGVRPLDAAEEAQVRSLFLPPRKERQANDALSPPPFPLAERMPDLLHTAPAAGAIALAATAPPARPTPPPLPPAVAAAKHSLPELALSAKRIGLNEPCRPPPLAVQVAALLRSPRVRLALVGSAALGLLLLLGIVWALRPEPLPPPPPPPEPEPPRLQPLAGLTLRSGEEHDVELIVERNYFEGPLALAVHGVPEGVRCRQELTVAAGEDRACLHLAAARGAVVPKHPVRVTLLADGRKVDEQTLDLQVVRFDPPLLGEPSPPILHPGQTQLLAVAVDLRGFTGKLMLTVKGLPHGVRQQPVPQTAGASVLRVQLQAAADARLWGDFVCLELRADSILADERLVRLAVEPPLPRLRGPEPLRIEPGGSAKLRIRLDRQGYRGPIRLTLDDLPEGMTCEPAALDGEQEEGEVAVRAEARVALGKQDARLLAVVNNRTVHDLPLTVHVAPPGTAGVPSRPRPGPGQTEVVRFVTADEVTLKGLLYPGGRGKKGACVLLVHDVGPGHSGSELAGLARALQTAGHTVLQFDLRGHGRSTAVDPAVFWTFPTNQTLPRPKDNRTSTIDADQISFDYCPWLVQDLAAARAFLDARHEDPKGPVNSSHLVVIGAGEGAMLGALWLAGECRRFVAKPAMPGFPVQIEGPSEIRQVAGAVWLSMPEPLEPRARHLHEWLKEVGRTHNVPMCFLHGADDGRCAARSRDLVQLIKGYAPVQPLTAARAVPNTALAAAQLLRPELDTGKLIAAFVDDVLKARGSQWGPRRYPANLYVWVFPDGAPVEAKVPGPRGLRVLPIERLGIHPLKLRPGGS